ncbi:unnamed protein product [Effrenium voratum]|nr:unnamed protein product [Effrenium voratum]
MWSFGLGSGLFLLTLLAWPSQAECTDRLAKLGSASIFLDRICIHQSDPRLKMEGVMSIGAFLKRSERMLVLWDASYMQRLWCVFEVAAFLKSRSADQEAHLQIVPVHMGSFCLVFGMAGASVYVIVWIVFMHGVVGWEILVLLPIIMTPAGLYAIADARAYMRSVHTLQEQLASFSLRNSRCSCCDWNHVRNGTPVPCDRDAIGHCIGEWFGAEAEFEHAIHSVVLPAFTSRFGEHLVPFRIFLVATVPLFWGMMDLVAGYAISERGREEGGTVSLWWLFAGFGIWLGVLPASCVWILALTRRLRASRGRILNAAVNLLIFALAAPALCFMLGLQIAVRDLADLVLGGDLATHLLPLWAGIGSSLQISIALLSWNFAKLRRAVDVALVRTDPQRAQEGGFRSRGDGFVKWQSSSAPATTFELSAESNITWWKGLKVIADSGDVLCDLGIQDGEPPARCELPGVEQHELLFSYKVELWKAKWPGHHHQRLGLRDTAH